jgi:hypothetical protein
MRIVEKVFIFLFLLGMLFKMQHYPGGGVFVVISLFSLSFVYLISGFQSINFKKPDLESLDIDYLIKEKVVKKPLVSNFPIGLFITISLNAILFKIQHYPGQTMLFFLGIGSFIFALSYTYIRSREQFGLVVLDNGIRIFVVLLSLISIYWDMISYYLFPLGS